MDKLCMNLSKSKYLKVTRYAVNEELLDKRGRFYLYFLFKGSKLVYLGRTEDIQSRITAHKSGLWLKNWFTHFRIIECKSYSKLCKYEKRLISLFEPKYNGRKKPSGSDLSYEDWHIKSGRPIPNTEV